LKFIESKPSIEDYYPLYLSTGWDDLLVLSKLEAENSLANSFSCVCAYSDNELLGFGRVISDGVVYTAIL